MEARAELKVADVRALLAVVRLGSINGAARATSVTPSQISKAVVRVETYLGARLLLRSATGVHLSGLGEDAVPRLIDLVERIDSLGSASVYSELTIVGTSFVNGYFLPALITALPELTIQMLQAAPGVPSALARQPLFDVSLALGRHRWPSSWAIVEVGFVRKALYGSPALARRLQRGGMCTPESIRDELFVGPIYSNGDQVVQGDDGCPLPRHARRFGHRTETVALALSAAQRSAQLVFSPAIAAQALVEEGKLVEIAVRGWNVRDPLYLACHQERVSARVQRIMLSTLRGVLRGTRAKHGRA